MGAWKEVRTQAKLEAIEESRKYDVLELQKAKSFIKREVTTACPSKARLIQGNDNEITAYRDPDMYRAIADACKHIAFQEGGIDFDLRYTSGCNNDKLSQLLSQEIARPGVHVFDERDGKNWDSTMQEKHMRFEASIYALVDRLLAAQHLERSKRTRGTIRMKDAIVKYITAWKRLSGDWNTSVGNTLISMAILITVLLALPAEMRPQRVFGFFLGDDYLGVYTFPSKPDLAELNKLLKSGEESCGITPVRGMTTDVLSVEYTSLTVWPTYSGGVQFVPKLSNMLVKLFHTIHPPNRHTAADVLATIKALQPSFCGLLFMEKFFAWHSRSWKTAVRLPSTSHLLSLYQLEALTTQPASVNWAYGFVHKFRIPITCFDIPLPPIGSAYYLESDLVNQIYALEHRDPDVRLTLQ